MSNRLNQERVNKIQPKRMAYAIEAISKKGYLVESDNVKVWFDYLGSRIVLYPFSGWHTGKTIQDGRGIDNLLNQITQ